MSRAELKYTMYEIAPNSNTYDFRMEPVTIEFESKEAAGKFFNSIVGTHVHDAGGVVQYGGSQTNTKPKRKLANTNSTKEGKEAE